MLPVFQNTNDRLPERLPIPKLTRLTGPGKLFFVGVATQKIVVSGTQYKRVLVSGHALYWRRARRKVKEKIEQVDFDVSIDLFDWISARVNKRETVYVYFHDAVTDFLALDGFRQLPVQGFVLQSIYHKLTTTIMRFSNGNRRVTVLDAQNYYPVKLDILARSFGVEIEPEPPDQADPKIVTAWCQSKAGLLHTIMQKLVQETIESGRGPLRMTASSTAHSIYRTSYMKHKIITNHNPEIVAFEQASYIGGYTGLGRLVAPGEPDLYKVDVNSMYPSVMLERKYPTQLIEFAEGVTVRNLERFLHGYMVIAEVELNARHPYYPLRVDETAHYPLGKFRTVLSTAALKHALDQDEIAHVYKIAVYMGHPIFSEFVTDVYGRRVQAAQDGNTAYALMQKAINNTLYGKFGQLQTDTVRVGDAPIDEFIVMDAFSPENNQKWIELHAGGSMLFMRRGRETRYTSFAIASHITDYARMKLFGMMDQAGRENVSYVDTDSMIVNGEGLRRLYNLLDPVALGKLKMEGIAPFYIGFAKKDYVFGDVRKLKGFSEHGKRVDENLLSMYQRVGFGARVAKHVQDGPYWHVVNKRYNPFLVGEKIGKEGEIIPVSLPYEEELLRTKRHTLYRVKDLCRWMLNDAQRSMIGEWLYL